MRNIPNASRQSLQSVRVRLTFGRTHRRADRWRCDIEIQIVLLQHPWLPYMRSRCTVASTTIASDASLQLRTLPTPRMRIDDILVSAMTMPGLRSKKRPADYSVILSSTNATIDTINAHVLDAVLGDLLTAYSCDSVDPDEK